MSKTPQSKIPFWDKPLQELSASEWESLCDGCGRCCLKKLQDEADESVHWSRVVCRYFDESTHRCSCYQSRSELVPDCLDVKRMDILANLHWMPDTCAYRMRAEGKPLAAWHPLRSGSREAMEEAGIPIGGRVLSEEYVHPDGYQEHIIRWIKS